MKEESSINQSLAINHSYKQHLVKYLVTNEFDSTYIYILASPNGVYMFEKSKAVEFLHKLKSYRGNKNNVIQNIFRK